MFNILLTLILSLSVRVQSVCYTRCSLRSLAIAIASSYHNIYTTTYYNKHTSVHLSVQPVYPQQYPNHPQKFKAKGKTFSIKLIKDRGVGQIRFIFLLNFKY